LSHGVQVVGVAWCAATRIMAGLGDLVQKTGNGRTGRVLSGQVIEKSGGVMCGLHRARGDEERGFLGCALKTRSTVCEWFGLKITRTVFAGLASKLVATVSNGLASKPAATVSSGLASKPDVTDFSGLTSKPVVTISSGLASKLVATVSSRLASKSVVGFLVEPQNQGGGGFFGLGLKTGSLGLVI
jgi:hypothetical protein